MTIKRCYIKPSPHVKTWAKDYSQTCSAVHAWSLYVVGVLNYSPMVGFYDYVLNLGSQSRDETIGMLILGSTCLHITVAVRIE